MGRGQEYPQTQANYAVCGVIERAYLNRDIVSLSFTHFLFPSSMHSQRFVEFFDSRACVKAHHSGQNLSFHRGSFDVKYAWDSPK